VFKTPAEGVAHDLVAVMMPFAAHFTLVNKAIADACDMANWTVTDSTIALICQGL
jgi:hypothetical protein